MAAAAQTNCVVHTFDINPPGVTHERVCAYQADFRTADIGLLKNELADLARPILVIEDAHVAVDRTLRMVAEVLADGDYLVVEDSGRKQSVLGDFAASSALGFEVVEWLLDFYGTNATCAINSIWKCTGRR